MIRITVKTTKTENLYNFRNSECMDMYVTNAYHGLVAVGKENCVWKSGGSGVCNIDIHPTDKQVRTEICHFFFFIFFFFKSISVLLSVFLIIYSSISQLSLLSYTLSFFLLIFIPFLLFSPLLFFFSFLISFPEEGYL